MHTKDRSAFPFIHKSCEWIAYDRVQQSNMGEFGMVGRQLQGSQEGRLMQDSRTAWVAFEKHVDKVVHDRRGG